MRKELGVGGGVSRFHLEKARQARMGESEWACEDPLGSPSTPNHSSSCENKTYTGNLLARTGIPTPKAWSHRPETFRI